MKIKVGYKQGIPIIPVSCKADLPATEKHVKKRAWNFILRI